MCQLLHTDGFRVVDRFIKEYSIILKFDWLHIYDDLSISFLVTDSEKVLALVHQEKYTMIFIEALFIRTKHEIKPLPIKKSLNKKCCMFISQNINSSQKQYNHSCTCQCGGTQKKMLNYESEKSTCIITII